MFLRGKLDDEVDRMSGWFHSGFDRGTTTPSVAERSGSMYLMASNLQVQFVRETFALWESLLKRTSRTLEPEDA
jgi:hypothetical protein